jgi:hypothetical protein
MEINGENWADAVNTLVNRPNVREILSVRNIINVPLNEQISLVEAKCLPRKSAWAKQTAS